VPGDAGTTQEDAAAAGPQLAVSADFLNQTLSIFDVNKLKEGATRADVLVGSVDLSAYTPGPLTLAITPDGKTALVSISAGFLNFFITVPPGDGTLLFVDLATRKVVGELFTGKSPMGIAISPDGKRAFVGHFSETYFAVVDIEKRTFEKVETGLQFNEEFALDDTGTVGALTYGPIGDVKTFSVADPKGTLGQTTGVTGDAAGVAFFPGTKLAYLVQAPTSLNGNVGGHNVVNVENPAMPQALDNVRSTDMISIYPVTPVGPRKSVAFPRTKDNQLSLTEMKLEGQLAVEVQTVPIGPAKSLAYGVTAARDGRVLVAVPGEHYVGVVDLATQKAFSVPWEVTKSGPNDIKLIP
jgi:DNA-binding beta-propeller fold protein YncE